jgi:hypothetical protein
LLARQGHLVAIENGQSNGSPANGTDNCVKGHRRHIVLICGCAAVFALIAVAYYLLRPPETVFISRQSAGAAIPVSVAFATRQDVPVYLTGLGTVQASFTVDIRAKVDGELHQVLFTDFQLPTIFTPTMAPNSMSVRRDSPRHMTVFPGGGSLARSR